MNGICSDARAGASEVHDLIVVGGGIYGSAMALEAARRGLRCLLVERDDFGGATSANSLGMIGGGLAHLAHLDLKRCVDSARERSWFLENFAAQVQPIACLMPLDGRGFRRATFFRAATGLYERLTAGIAGESSRLPSPRIIDREGLRHVLGVPRSDVRAAAVWHEALVSDPQRLFMELLHWAAACGAVCLNYTEARELLLCGGRVAGVLARDRRTGSFVEFRAARVVNCAGPWSRRLAAAWDRDDSRLFKPLLAFNLWLDVESPSMDHALRVPGRTRHGRAFWVVPQSRGVVAGTRWLPTGEPAGTPVVAEEHVFDFLTELKHALPGWNVHLEHVRRIFAGYVPAGRAGSSRPGRTPVFIDHGARGGPCGLYSISGTDYTTSRLVAERSLGRILGSRPGPRHDAGQSRPRLLEPPGVQELVDPRRQSASMYARVRQLCESESVLHLDDLMLRRTNWAMFPECMDLAAEVVCAALGWDEARRVAEKARLALALRQSSNPWSIPAPRRQDTPPFRVGHGIA